MLRKLILVLILSSFASLCTASSADAPPAAETPAMPEAFAAMLETVRAELQPGGKYESVSERDRRKLDTQLSIMEKILTGVSSIDDLNDRQRIRLMNAQEMANSILTDNRNGRLVCENYKPVGSQHHKKVCVSVAQRDNIRENSRAYINDAQNYRALPGNGPRVPGGGGD